MMNGSVLLRNCSQCNSSEVTPNREGFLVCHSCGSIYEEHVNFGRVSFTTASNQPTSYGHAIHTNLSRTQLGTRMERANTKFASLEKVQSQGFSYESKVEWDAITETSRICSNLGMPSSFVNDVLKIFKGVWEKTRHHTMERSVLAFAPVVIYRSAQLLGYSLPLKQLIPEMQVSPRKFRNVLISTYHLFSRVNHYKNIIRMIKEICAKMKVPAQVCLTAIKIFAKERRELMLSTQNVAASAAVGMALIALKQRNKYPLMLVCKYGESSQASVTSRIFQVAESRKLKIYHFKIHELERELPKYYEALIKTTENFISPVMRDGVKYIHRIANELNMPFKVKQRAIKLLRANRRILLMTTKEVCASSVVGLAVLTLGLREKYPLYHIGKVLECSSSAIASRIFKVVQNRGIEGIYRISRLGPIVEQRYKDLLRRN